MSIVFHSFPGHKWVKHELLSNLIYRLVSDIHMDKMKESDA